MKNSKIIFFALIALITVIVVGETTHLVLLKNHQSQKTQTRENASSATTTKIVEAPCVLQRAPDGNMVPVCMPQALHVVDMPQVFAVPNIIQGSPGGGNEVSLATLGNGTTTMKKATPFNDILIAESGSPYATLRNARYTIWPYPGDVALKEVYLVLPDAYDPIFSGYSNKQLIEFDGTKNIMLYLRHKQSTGVGADARIFIESPTATNEEDHPLKLFDSTDTWAGFSVITKGQEVIIEVIFASPQSISPDLFGVARKELLGAVENMEIIW